MTLTSNETRSMRELAAFTCVLYNTHRYKPWTVPCFPPSEVKNPTVRKSL